LTVNRLDRSLVTKWAVMQVKQAVYAWTRKRQMRIDVVASLNQTVTQLSQMRYRHE